MNRPHCNHLQSNSISNCHECGISQSVCWILHNVRFKASFRRLCTNCVLKNNLSRFCPLCFDIYDDSTPPSSHQRVMCFRCPSISHVSCASFRFSSTFLCPICSDPCFAFFDGFDSGGLRQSEPAVAVLAGRDGKSAKAIVAAARVAAQSMRRAAADARAVAEMKIRNAVFAKKQATLALERLAYLVLHGKDRNGYAKTNGNAAAGAVEEEEETELQGEVVTAILERMKANQTQF
ncbi:uncharacterized protein LOC111790876 [Cucurbita pepo subsp. pepo]|uniref:uncharacterized protein LOC111790876 n=1 Tax=Cucurbita pepo subsp. pepo TaxID=3664 RepID=UPI000C9D64B2|nr:uncharacterized protein LOC111790876 [Cucurbita pepo subsp. pepo]XP_023527751.1 uncharacterized protein LOC111790876 [Cucurbita pepo subsp. pepo]